MELFLSLFIVVVAATTPEGSLSGGGVLAECPLTVTLLNLNLVRGNAFPRSNYILAHWALVANVLVVVVVMMVVGIIVAASAVGRRRLLVQPFSVFFGSR